MFEAPFSLFVTYLTSEEQEWLIWAYRKAVMEMVFVRVEFSAPDSDQTAKRLMITLYRLAWARRHLYV